MGFKSDREFLRNITVGAVGTRQVARLLRQAGFQIIELERCATSNKIWTTKIKRLRVPDLLCIHSGVRIESRAKSALKVTMSHAVNSRDRAWDAGLRDDDLVAFIRCTLPTGGKWTASSQLRLFRVGDMRATQEAAGLSRMKAASEGSEIQLTWPATIPGRPGRVLEVTNDEIVVEQDTGRRQRYKLLSRRGKGTNAREYRLDPYVGPGDSFGAGDEIIASVVPRAIALQRPQCDQYDFIADLDAGDRATVYAAAKALGCLPNLKRRSVEGLGQMAKNHDDAFVRLESAAALARLGVESGWRQIEETITATGDRQSRMEVVLILGELEGPRPATILAKVAQDRSNESELRAAAAWSMATIGEPLSSTLLLELLADNDELTAIHALVATSRLIDADSLDEVLDKIGSDMRQSAAIVRAIGASRCDPTERVVRRLQKATGTTRQWLLYLLASLGRTRSEECINRVPPELLPELEFFWRHHTDNWTNRLDVADQIDFQLAQILH